MNDFEQKLLETGSFELICSYVKNNKTTLSSEFKTILIDKIKDLKLDLIQLQEDILNKDIKSFLEIYCSYKTTIPKVFFEQCEKLNICTAKDLLSYGSTNILKMENIGRVTLQKIEDTFYNAGFNFD